MVEKANLNKNESIFENFAVYNDMVTEFSWRKFNKKNQIDPKKILKKGKLIIGSKGNKQKNVKTCNYILISDKLIEEVYFNRI